MLKPLLVENGESLLKVMRSDLLVPSSELLKPAMNVMFYCLQCSISFVKQCYLSDASLNSFVSSFPSYYVCFITLFCLRQFLSVNMETFC